MLHGDALFVCADVLRAAGNNAEATSMLRRALELYEEKENVPEVDRTRALLANAAYA